MTKTTKFILSIIAIVVVIGAIGILTNKKTINNSSNLDSFAQCLSDSGAKFYGAFWCPHCQAQKKEFGSSAKYLPYVECSTPDGKGQTQICKDKKIEGYPTWIFADGSQLSGETSLQDLAGKTGCSLPQDKQQ